MPVNRVIKCLTFDSNNSFMKKILLLGSILFNSLLAQSQTATNFNCNDCAGNNHDLFSELNSGKVIVIAWVMPCASCISGALAAQSACQGFATSNPGEVFFYCSDDLANTSCATLSNWCATNGMSSATKFSNAAVNMTSYGAAGMPKVVVLGGTSHTLYYNQNDAGISQPGIQAAISAALAANANGIKENNGLALSVNIYPNPSQASSTLSVTLENDKKLNIEVQDLLGHRILEVFKGDLSKGTHNLVLTTSELPNGSYLLTCTDGANTKKIKFSVLH